MTNNLRRLRLAAGLSVDELADRSSLGRATIVRAERGVPISDNTRWRLELALRHALDERTEVVNDARRALVVPSNQ